jgi:8-oxo-dGTP diphosphatase
MATRRAYALITNDEGRILLVRNRAGKWTLPGGRARPGETLKSAAKREIEEETGLKVRIRHGAPHRHVRRHTDECKRCVVYAADIKKGRARPKAEITDIAWVKPDKAPAKLAAFPTRRFREVMAAVRA